MIILTPFPFRSWLTNYISWRLCSLHNQVNERLNKPEYDCSQLSTEYDCGCGDDPLDSTSTKATVNSPKFDPMDLEIDTTKDEITGAGLIKGGRWCYNFLLYVTRYSYRLLVIYISLYFVDVGYSLALLSANGTELNVPTSQYTIRLQSWSWMGCLTWQPRCCLKLWSLGRSSDLSKYVIESHSDPLIVVSYRLL